MLSPILFAMATLLVSMVTIPKLTLCPSHHLHSIYTLYSHMHNVRLLCIQLRISPLPPTLPSPAIIQSTPLSVSVCVCVLLHAWCGERLNCPRVQARFFVPSPTPRCLNPPLPVYLIARCTFKSYNHVHLFEITCIIASASKDTTQGKRDRPELARSIQGILTDTLSPITNDNVLCCLLYLSAIFLAEERYFLSAMILI